MKRKLDQDDVPTPILPDDKDTHEVAQKVKPLTEIQTFQDLGLDTRLVQAVTKQGFSRPTAVQSQAIPLAFDGKDVLVHARTGSGKTAAYLLPILESTLRRKKANSTGRYTSALVLVPTRELASQITKVTRSFTLFCAKEVRVVNLTEKASDDVQRAWLDECPDVVVTTPSRALIHLNSNSLKLTNLTYVVLDEADLLFSYGYEEDLQNISKVVATGAQTIMASATLTTDVDAVKGLFCRDPVMLQIDEEAEENGVSQYLVKCSEEDKFLLAFVIFKLKLVKGKCIIFVADIDRCYRLKLFFEQFGIRSCVLNSELPVNSRIHVVEEFNKNVYDIVIASDEIEVVGNEGSNKDVFNSTQADQEASNGDEQNAPKKRKSAKKSKRDKDYGVSRGIDFKNVACVLNFDLPPTSKSYIHRIGRTGRAGRPGMALSFVVSTEEQGRHKHTSIESTAKDEKVIAKIIEAQQRRGQEVQDYVFDENAVDRFRYRMNDALRAVTGLAIREARTRELRQELINSDRLKRHFEENPDDLHHLRHDGELRAARVQAHLKHVPDYLLPNGGGHVAKDIGFVGLRKTTGENRIRKARERNRRNGKGRNSKKNPLKTFRSKSGK